MKISFNTNNYNFKSTKRIVSLNSEGRQISSDDRIYIPSSKNRCLWTNYTTFFRSDLFTANKTEVNTNTWKPFLSTIIDEFKDAPKVNVYNFACSDGSEPYSLALGLIDELGDDEAEKFFPINASDRDKVVIHTAKKGVIPALLSDVQYFRRNLKSGIGGKDYTFEYSYDEDGDEFPYKFVAQDELKDKVKFERLDIKEAISSIEPSNSLVLCRNVWAYLPLEDREEIAQKLSDKLDSTSLLVIGDYDCHAFGDIAADYGFEEVCHLIYRKK